MLREQFIAVLGHDLRNPLASIICGDTAHSEVEAGREGRGNRPHDAKELDADGEPVDNFSTSRAVGWEEELH